MLSDLHVYKSVIIENIISNDGYRSKEDEENVNNNWRGQSGNCVCCRSNSFLQGWQMETFQVQQLAERNVAAFNLAIN